MLAKRVHKGNTKGKREGKAGLCAAENIGCTVSKWGRPSNRRGSTDMCKRQESKEEKAGQRAEEAGKQGESAGKQAEEAGQQAE